MRTRHQFLKFVNDYIVKKRKDKEGESKKSRDSHATNATDQGKNGDESDSNTVRWSEEEMVRIRSDEEDKRNRKISRKKMKETAKRGKIGVVDDDKGSGSDVRILGEEVNMEEFTRRRKRSKETVYKGNRGHNDDDDEEGSGSDVVFVDEGYVPYSMRDDVVNGKKKFSSRRKKGRVDVIMIDEMTTVENERSGEGAQDKGKGLLDENLDAFALESSSSKEDADCSDNLVKGNRVLESGRKRGIGDGIRIDEWVTVENELSGEGAQDKGKGLLVENLDALDPQSSSFEVDAYDSDIHVKGRKLFVSIKGRGRSDGTRIDERTTVGNEHSEDALELQSSSSEEDANDSDEDYNEEESSSTDIQSADSGYDSEENPKELVEKDGNKNSETSGEDSDSSNHLTKDKKMGTGSRMPEISKRREGVSIGSGYCSEDNPEQKVVKDDCKNFETSDEYSDSSDHLPKNKKKVGSRIPEISKRRGRVPTGSGYCSEKDETSGEDCDSSAHHPKKKIVGSKVSELSKRRKKASRDVDYMNILLGSILKDDQEKRKPFSFEDSAPPTHTLPLKFRFEDEYPAPPEKEEWEKEIDALFAELEMCLTLPDSGSTESSTDEVDYQDGADHVTATEKSPIELCALGQHQLVLEEPLGIICRCCQIVYREMKYIFPDLKKDTPGRRDWFNLPRDGYCGGIHDLHFGEASSENYYTSMHSRGSVLDLIPEDIKLSMYRHQWEGFCFLWKKTVGETCIEKLKTELSDDGEGAILSHAPGTGKTLLTIAFIASLLERYPTCRPVIIAPKSMLLTWESEFQKWGYTIPFHNYNSKDLSGKEVKIHADILQKVGSRMTKLYSWTKQPSVLGISYKMFERIVSERLEKRSNAMVMVRQVFLELPGLLVLDEGHTPRNNQSLVYKDLTGVKTRRKIILSGTPFQNNFDELFNTLSLVNPKLSGPMTSESCIRWGQRRKSNVEKERWFSLANKIDDKSGNGLEELKAMVDPFVHVHKGTILEERLPGLKDTLVILRPTDVQKKILQFVSDDFNSFDQAALVSHISVHPSLAAFCKRFSNHKDKPEAPEGRPYAGVKTKFTVELIKLCVSFHEKVLVFSEHIRPLKFIMQELVDQLKWTEGREILYMDGKCEERHRQASISSLNDALSEVKVLFASIKACSEGINLSGASRVVLLDAVWNPSVERQAISRAYRLGQKKVVHVYHLITIGTLEIDKYRRQANKDRLSELVFSSRCGQSIKSRTTSEDKILEAMLENECLREMFEDIIHQPKDSNVFTSFNYVQHKH